MYVLDYSIAGNDEEEGVLLDIWTNVPGMEL